jgi:hypothetical protein
LLDKPGGNRKADFNIRKYLFGCCRLRLGIHSRNSQEQAERVVWVTPLASGGDLRRKTAFFKPSATLGLEMPISSSLVMMDAVT